MFFHRAGWRIKHLVSHRKNNSLEDSTENLHVHYLDSTISADISRRTSWLSQAPTETPTARRTSTGGISNTRRLPSACIGTAHSSTSSLCSCDCCPKTSAVDISLSKVESKDRAAEILHLPPLPSTTTSGDARIWRLIFSEQLSPPQRSSPPNIGEKGTLPLISVPEVTLDLLEALEIEPEDHEKTPTPSINTMSGADHAKILDGPNNAKQLIRKADLEFQPEEQDEAAIVRLVTRTIAAPRGISKKQHNSSFNSSAKTSRLKSKSAAKGKRSVFYRKRIAQRSLVAPKVAHPPSNTLWTNVTTNMVDVLNRKMFRTEVDEMLTPSRMRQLRSSVKIDTQRKVSSESTQSIDSDCSTPTEPFHLESLSARINAAIQASPVGHQTPRLPPLPTIPQDKRGYHIPKTSLALPPGDPEMTYEDLNFPSPPPLPRRSSLRPKAHRAATLPTISESATLTLPPINPDLPSGASTPGHVTLHSTPFTMTSPLFRHGNIRVERRRQEDALPDETLDWTAFQMAISGTMDDDVGTNEAMESARDEAELDDLACWWEDMRLPLGSLLRETPKVQRMVRYVRDENNRETPWKGRMSAEGCTWGVKMEEEHPESMPASPMVEFATDGDGEVNIPMGYNLGHDLGDFLSWEMHHVSLRGGLYDSERER